MTREHTEDGGHGLGSSGLKAELRRKILARRDAMSADARRELSEAIFAQIIALDAFCRSTAVLSYSSFGSEPVTDTFSQTVLRLGKALVLPKVSRDARTLQLYRVHEPGEQLQAGVWGIREPNPSLCALVSLHQIDFILVPGVVFDVRGGRIGYGGGYYDRLIEKCPDGPHLIAAAFETQIVEQIPMDPHDRRMDKIITERRAYPA